MTPPPTSNDRTRTTPGPERVPAAPFARVPQTYAHGFRGLAETLYRWPLLDLADRALPGLDVPSGICVAEATADGVRLTGSFVPTRSLIWRVGVRPDPLVADLGLETAQGRLVVDEYLTVPGP